MKISEQENGETTGKHSLIPKEGKEKREQRSNETIPQGQPMRCEATRVVNIM